MYRIVPVCYVHCNMHPLHIAYAVRCIKHVREILSSFVHYLFTIRSRLNVARIEYQLIIATEIRAAANVCPRIHILHQ